jgi:hypothetical protein
MSFDLVGNTITIEQGSTFSLSLNWTNSADETIDLTSYSWTARMKGREDKESSTEVFSWTSGAELILSDSNPNIRIEVEASATAAYTAPLLGWYDLELVDATSNVYKIISGVLQIDREVTR